MCELRLECKRARGLCVVSRSFSSPLALLSPTPLKDLLFLIIYESACTSVWVCDCSVCRGRKKGVRAPGTGVTWGGEPPHMGAGSWTWVTCKSNSTFNCQAVFPAPGDLYNSSIGILLARLRSLAALCVREPGKCALLAGWLAACTKLTAQKEGLGLEAEGSFAVYR